MSRPLRDIADVHYGKSPNGAKAEDSSIPVIGTGGVYGYVDEALYPGPAVVVPRKGSLGNPRFAAEPFWASDTTYVVLPKPGVNAKWLFYSLDNFDLTKLNEATGVPSISRDWLYKIRLGDADYQTQRRIAEILSTVDEAIEQTEALIAKTQAIKAGLMHDLFTRGVLPDGRFRPPREEAPELYKESQLGWIPREWECKKLGIILDHCGGYLQTGPFGSQLHAYEYQTEGVPVVMPQDINDGCISTSQIARITEKRARDLSRHRMKYGDIVIARRGDLSRAAAISHDEQEWICGTGCFLLRLGQSALHPRFAAYAYRQHFVQRQIAGRAVGTTMPSLNNAVMAGLWFPFCGKDEQVRIVDRLAAIESKIKSLTKYSIAIHKVKLGLMHDLLTGLVQVKTSDTVGLQQSAKRGTVT